MSRTFTLQMHDRPPGPRRPVVDPRVRNAAQVYEHLDGHALRCPGCGLEPYVTDTRVDSNDQVVHSWRGAPVGVAIGPQLVTMEAECSECNCELTYRLKSDGTPHLVERRTVARDITMDGQRLGDGAITLKRG